MRNDELARLFAIYLQNKAQQNQTHTRSIKPETAVRLNAIREALADTPANIEYNLNSVYNCVDLIIRDYVFDSLEYNLRLILSLADSFTIDAQTDGKVCLSLMLANAFEQDVDAADGAI